MKYARKCSITNEGMNKGYVWCDGMYYLKYEKDLIAHIRKQGDSTFNEASDEYLLTESYNAEDYYYTEWDEIDGDYYYTADGECIPVEMDDNPKEGEYEVNVSGCFTVVAESQESADSFIRNQLQDGVTDYTCSLEIGEDND